MFSFIKFIQAMLKRIRMNKGLWFSILTFVSAVGIFLSMYLINSMSHNVAERIYLKIHKVNSIQLENTFEQKYNMLSSLGGLIAKYPIIINNIKTKSDKKVNKLILEIQKTINDSLIDDSVELHYYAKNFTATGGSDQKYADVVMRSNSPINGVVVNKEGVKIISISPIVDGDKVIGAIEVEEDVHYAKNDLEKFGKEFAFLLDKEQVAQIDIQYKQGKLEDIGEKYKTFFHDYDPNFYTYLKEIDVDDLVQKKYHNDKLYYTNAVEAFDIDGKRIGVYVMGEKGLEEDSFVKITQDLIKSVTTVALGLVISLVLFMF